jgi:tetrahydromethanopterin S-methyltransferase subunit B
MTVEAVRERRKTVTRRHVDTWKNLRPGDQLTLVEKAMGLPKGAKQVVLAEVEIVDVRVESLGNIHDEMERGPAFSTLYVGPEREGVRMTCSEFVRFWAATHGYNGHSHPADILCRRIEWRYLDEVEP